MLTGEVLRLTAQREPHRTAVVCGGDRIDYRALEEDANRFAHAVGGAGLGAGDKLAIMAANVAQYPVVHFGAAMEPFERMIEEAVSQEFEISPAGSTS